MLKKFIIVDPLDMHLHLREGNMLSVVAPLSSLTFVGGIIMPNTVEKIITKKQVTKYKKDIVQSLVGKAIAEDKVVGDINFRPMMTLFFKPNYSKEFLESVKDVITAIKLYPDGVTTNSEGGVASMDIEELRPTLTAMSELEIPLCVHGETNGFVMDREKEFVTIYESLAKNFPDLKIIMEHITTKECVALLDKYEKLYATVTLHHLMITLDDIAGGMLQPHNFCKPIAKRPEDRTALQNAALNANPKLMFGSDSAPHPKHKKECCGCAAGVFTAPIALQLLVELFEKNDSLDNLQAFVSDNAKKIYKLKNIPTKTVSFVKNDFVIPKSYDMLTQNSPFIENIIPFMAGETTSWSIDEVINE